MSRKKKKQMKATAQERENQSSLPRTDGGMAQIFPMVGETGVVTPTFPKDGDQNQQVVLQVLRTLLQQAAGGH